MNKGLVTLVALGVACMTRLAVQAIAVDSSGLADAPADNAPVAAAETLLLPDGADPLLRVLADTRISPAPRLGRVPSAADPATELGD